MLGGWNLNRLLTEDDEHSVVSFVDIFRIFVVQDIFFVFGMMSLDIVEKQDEGRAGRNE